MVKRGAEQTRERMARTALNSHEVPSNQDDKEGSQESARRVQNDQQDIERPWESAE